MARIIVGVDGSPLSARVLTFALREAAAFELPLIVCAVYPAPGSIPAWGMAAQLPRNNEVEDTRRGAQNLVDTVVAESGATGVEVTVRASAGVPADELLQEAGPDDRLIVGSRGAGGFRRMFLGSVSSDVVHSAMCPVTVVPTSQRV